MEFELIELKHNEAVEMVIKHCQKSKHIQQVAYSTYHSCITQICFNCKKIRTTIKT